MKLVVYSNESLETLERYVREIFSGIKNYNIPSPLKNYTTPYGKNELG